MKRTLRIESHGRALPGEMEKIREKGCMNQKNDATVQKIGTGILILSAAALLWHSRLSFCQSDESFYLALAHRLWSGDRLILDEWHVVQFYSPILLPFYSLFRLFVPGGDGVFLYARVLYLCFALYVSIKLFRRVCLQAPAAIALVSALLVLFYSRANISGPSYYNLCLLFCILALLHLTSGKNRQRETFAAGVLISLAVLCNPFLALFVIPTAVVGTVNRNSRPFWGPAVVGIVFSAILYVVLFLPWKELPALADTLPVILRGDPQHKKTLAEMYEFIGRQAGQWILPAVYYVGAFGCLARLLFRDVSRVRWSRTVYLLAGAAALVPTLCKAKESICFVISVPFAILMATFAVDALLNKEKSTGLYLYLTGLALSAAFSVGSNTGLDAMTVGACAASAGGMLLALDWSRCDPPGGTWQHVATICLCGLMLVPFTAHRFLGIYRDAPVQCLTRKLDRGPAAGLYTTPDHAQEYTQIYDQLQKLDREYPDARILITKRLPWGYLAADWRCACFTAWTVEIRDPRLELHFRTHEEPTIVVLLEESTTGWETAPFNSHKENHQFNRDKHEGAFYERLVQQADRIIQTPTMSVYHLPPRSGTAGEAG